ncbi:phosphoribosylamine--glycine ligase N-terminal domain-containing protein, partial [Enterococcus faecium]
MNILLLGSGGREHALAWKMSQSHHCDNLYIAPGNAGTARVGTNLSLSPTDFNAV